MRNLVRRLGGEERGDVPGWVLISVMSAGLVTTLWLVADDQLSAVLQQAIDPLRSDRGRRGHRLRTGRAADVGLCCAVIHVGVWVVGHDSGPPHGLRGRPSGDPGAGRPPCLGQRRTRGVGAATARRGRRQRPAVVRGWCLDGVRRDRGSVARMGLGLRRWSGPPRPTCRWSRDESPERPWLGRRGVRRAGRGALGAGHVGAGRDRAHPHRATGGADPLPRRPRWRWPGRRGPSTADRVVHAHWDDQSIW